MTFFEKLSMIFRRWRHVPKVNLATNCHRKYIHKIIQTVLNIKVNEFNQVVFRHLVKIGRHPLGNLVIFLGKIVPENHCHFPDGQGTIHEIPEEAAALLQRDSQEFFAVLEPGLQEPAQNPRTEAGLENNHLALFITICPATGLLRHQGHEINAPPFPG